jgi:hypothetical protein
LCVCHNLPVGGVGSREVLDITFARLEGTLLSGVGGVEFTANSVEPVLTELRGIGLGRVAGFETELVVAHETRSCGVRDDELE